MASAVKRGFKFEVAYIKAAGLVKLPDSFKVFDAFSDGVATSIKSLDTTKPSYQKMSQLKSTLKKQVNAIIDFKGAKSKKTNFELTTGMIKTKELVLIIPTGTSDEALDVINKVAVYAGDNDIVFKIIEAVK